jgi:hypothetical protein
MSSQSGTAFIVQRITQSRCAVRPPQGAAGRRRRRLELLGFEVLRQNYA